MAYTQSNGLFYIQGGEYGPGTPNSECVVQQFFALDLTKPWADLNKPAYFNMPGSDKGAVMNSYHVATHSLDNNKVYTLGWNSGAKRSCQTEPGSGTVDEGTGGQINKPTTLIMRYEATAGQWSAVPDGSAVPNSLTEGWRDFQGALSTVSGRFMALGGNAGINGTDKRNQQLVLDTDKEIVSVKVIPATSANNTGPVAPSRTGYGIGYVKGGRSPGWYVLGGRDLATGAPALFTALDVLKDTANMNEWVKETATGTAPTARDRHCVASGSSDLFILDTTTMTWKQATNNGPAGNPVGYSACTVVGNQFIVWAGFLTPYGKPVSTPAGALKVYDTAQDAWVTSYTPPAAYASIKPILPPGMQPSDGGNGGNGGTPGSDKNGGGGDSGGTNVALIGGAAGGGVAAILLAVGLFIFFRRRKQRNARNKGPSISGPTALNPAAHRKPGDDETPPHSPRARPPSSPSSLPSSQSPRDSYRMSTATSDHRMSKADTSRFSVADSMANGGGAVGDEYHGPYYLPKLRKINRVSKEIPELEEKGDYESVHNSKEDLSRLQLEEEEARKRMNEAEAASMTIPALNDRRSRAQSEQYSSTPGLSAYAPEYLLIPLADRNSVAGSVATSGGARPHSAASEMMFTPPYGIAPRWSMAANPNSASQSHLPTVPEAMPMGIAMVPTSGAGGNPYADGSGSRLNSAGSHLESRLLSWYGANPYARPPMPQGAAATAAAAAAAMGGVVAPPPPPGSSSPSNTSYESSCDPVSALTSGLTSFPDTSAPLSPIPPSYPPPPPLMVREVRASPQFVPFDPNNPSSSKPLSQPVSSPYGVVPPGHVLVPASAVGSSEQGPMMTWPWSWAGLSNSSAAGSTPSATEAAMAAAAAAAMGHSDHQVFQYTPHLQAVHLPSIESPLPSGSLPSGSLPSQTQTTMSLIPQYGQQPLHGDFASSYKIPRSADMPSIISDEDASMSTTTSSSSPPSHRYSTAPQTTAAANGRPVNFP
ncbi:hypothetical protein DFQ27_005005 [Actinomortierella ambigua]|uniref:Uncharacterized protein n=1 Tax=Actinomortierella ambigua TaxID=1343610 RepID=A0A9P6U379_9FUNG|nr:hypothetical protein DFQ27_005005 [Actinomortierella ambigua]